MAVPYYYSELKKNSEKNNLNKTENVHGKSHGFDNPLLAIEPDIAICDIPIKASTFQKKKKKKKSIQAPVYLRSNSLQTNRFRMSGQSNYARSEIASSGEGTSNGGPNNKEPCHKRRNSEPNIYEEIPEQSYDDSCYYTGSVKSYVAVNKLSQGSKSYDCNGSSTKIVLDEVEKVQQRHAQILENLNLDVEAMLMPEETCMDDLKSEINKYADHTLIPESKTFHLISPGTPPLYFSSSHWQASGSGTLPKASAGRCVMNEYILQQSDFSPVYKASGYGPKVISTAEDNIYEEVDLYQMNDDVCWVDSETGGDQYASSPTEDVDDETGAAKLAARFIAKKKKNSKRTKENEKVVGGFTRWFSTRKKEFELDRGPNKIHKQTQDEDGYVDVKIPKKQRPPLSLPPVPLELTPEKMKRRYIIASIVDSENSYLNSLQRLIRDYKHPLENATPPIVSANKISMMFHRVEQLLQCHNIFGIALTQCIRQWDQEEKIGDVFVASFSKIMILDIYSDFINNFSVAMETAKQATKNKSAFSDFLKAKQINSYDRLSFFGLMVKPVQRFPQFILMLQDLLKSTPPGHHDRMSLQLALTQLESLAECLNERKREAEQHHAVREVLKHLGKFSFKSSMDRDHFLLRQDNVLQLQLDQNGAVVKSKERRLFLLNDLLVSVGVIIRNNDGIVSGERLSLKWAVSLQDVEICDDLNICAKNLMMFSSRNKNAGNRIHDSNSDMPGDQIYYEELKNLIHDKDIIARIESLILSLKKPCKDLNVEVTQNISASLQESIQQKCEEISLMESCRLQLSVPFRSKSNKEMICFQMSNPSVKWDWTTDLRLAKLALDPNNLPAWDMTDQEKRTSSKMPLFVKNFPVFQASSSSEVKCGCHYVASSSCQQYLWICSSDSLNSHIVIMTVHSTHLRQVAVYHLSDTKIITIESVPAASDSYSANTETVWLGTENQKIIVLEGACPEKWEEIGTSILPAQLNQLKYHMDKVYIGLTNGSIVIFQRNADGQWLLENSTFVSLSQSSVDCFLPLGLNMYCGSGSKIWIVDSLTFEIQKNYSIHPDNDEQVYLLAHSGTGIWIALKNSATICLYHTETFRYLQDINISSNVNHILRAKDKERLSNSIYVTSLLASKGLLWVGTNVGVVLTVPLPRLEGVPIVTGRISVAFHAHQGPVQLLLSLQPKSFSPILKSPLVLSPAVDETELCVDLLSLENKQALPSPVSSEKFNRNSGFKTLPPNVSLCPMNDREETNDVYGLYADLMNVQDYEKDSEEKLYERLNQSDPELMHFNLNNLDLRVEQKCSRPRSWDLSTMAVSEDSDSASTATSTGTTVDEKLKDEYSCLPTHVTLRKQIHKSSKNTDSIPKTILMLTGGSDYINWQKPEKSTKPCLDANVIIWEVKL